MNENVVIVESAPLSQAEIKEFKKLDKQFQQGQRESVEALQAIRDRKLYRNDFGSFTDYMLHYGRTTAWASQQIAWLRRTEILERNGIDVKLTVDEMQALGGLEDEEDAELYLLAVKEVLSLVSKGATRNRKLFDNVVERLDEQRGIVLEFPDLTDAEWETLQPIPHMYRSNFLKRGRAEELTQLVAQHVKEQEANKARKKTEKEVQSLRSKLAAAESKLKPSMASEAADILGKLDEAHEDEQEEKVEGPLFHFKLHQDGHQPDEWTDCTTEDIIEKLESVVAEFHQHGLTEGFTITVELQTAVVPMTPR